MNLFKAFYLEKTGTRLVEADQIRWFIFIFSHICVEVPGLQKLIQYGASRTGVVTMRKTATKSQNNIQSDSECGTDSPPTRKH